MKIRHYVKRLALAGFLLVLLLGVSGCLAKPDRVEVLPTEDTVVLPFETATPTPTPDPTRDPITIGFDAWEGSGVDSAVTLEPGATMPPAATAPVLTITKSPSQPTATIQLITASPTPVSAATSRTTSATPKPTSASSGSLRYGDTGSDVKKLQQRLKDLGYYTGSVDGTFGSGTESALKAFQKTNGLTSDGIAGSKTMSTLNSSKAKKASSSSANSAYATSRPNLTEYTPSTLSTYRYLQLGSSGSDVTRLQNRLKELGYFSGSVNGNFGDSTRDAVIAFQRRNGLWVDGVAGEDTQRLLFSSSALAASKSSTNTTDGTVSFTGYRTLTTGLTGDDVTLLQSRLTELGYYTGSVDGAYSPATAAAIQAFQELNGLTADGVAGTATQARIYSANALYAPAAASAANVSTQAPAYATLEMGSTGEDVYSLQERLYDLGYYADRIDGIYDQDVADAVKAFQKAMGLSADGKAGKSTLTKLYGDKAAASANADDTYATLRQGDSGERVRALQNLLFTYNYLTEDEIDGTYGPSTTDAVQRLQIHNGLTSDGVAGPATQQLLYQGSPVYAPSQSALAALSEETQQNYTTLTTGMESMDVLMVQQFLNELGYYYDEQDGIYGGTTASAIQAFQELNGLKADGVAGAETLALLYSGDGLPAEALSAYVPETPDRDVMREGDIGQDVFTMQERLYQLGYMTSGATGAFDALTTAAVKLFQQRNGLDSDGVAGKATVGAMYAAGAIAADATAQNERVFTTVNNQQRELDEQSYTGAIQGSLAGGGVAASYSSSVYYTGKNGTLYRSGSGSDKQLYDGAATFIHASEKGITFLSGNKVMRVATSGGGAQTLATGKKITKLAVVGDSLYYLDGGDFIRKPTNGEPSTLATEIKDFTINLGDYTAYLASSRGIYVMGLNGGGEQLVVSTGTDQVQLCDYVLVFRSGGNIYRMEDGISVLLLQADATWIGVYRDKIYYITGDALFRCDTAGLNTKLVYAGPAAGVSFVSGKAYITAKPGGEVVQIVSVD